MCCVILLLLFFIPPLLGPPQSDKFLNRGLWQLQGHIRVPLADRWGWDVPDDVANDFAELRDFLDMNGELYEVDAAYDEMLAEERREEARRDAAEGNPYY